MPTRGTVSIETMPCLREHLDGYPSKLLTVFRRSLLWWPAQAAQMLTAARLSIPIVTGNAPEARGLGVLGFAASDKPVAAAISFSVNASSFSQPC